MYVQRNAQTASSSWRMYTRQPMGTKVAPGDRAHKPEMVESVRRDLWRIGYIFTILPNNYSNFNIGMMQIKYWMIIIVVAMLLPLLLMMMHVQCRGCTIHTELHKNIELIYYYRMPWMKLI